MGLLSDPEYGSLKWVKILKKVHFGIALLCCVGAVTWFIMLGNKNFNNETYFSENALLPGLVTNEFYSEQSAKQYFEEFTEELKVKYKNRDDMPIPWLVGKMSQLNLEVYTHNFTLNYPLVKGQKFKGTNVYGILRAPRTSSLEALVVSAPYRARSSYQKDTTAGIALMLAFAKFARSQKYWAKDIIFLVTEHEQLGVQAWLEAYHGIVSDTTTFYTSLGTFWSDSLPYIDFQKFGLNLNENAKSLDPGKLVGRSGSIQAAINLEFHSPKIKYIEVKVEGLNGQLPNLDLVNLVHKLCAKSEIHHSYKNSFSWMRTRNEMVEWQNSLYTMLGMFTTQLAGVPNGNHGLFHRFGIEAVTLEGRDSDDPAGVAPKVHALYPTNFYRLGIALESILRSLNNLLERFHQSYFFYILAGTNRFISIGQYMPCLCLLCVAMLTRALAFWVTIQTDEEDTKSAKTTKTKSSESEELLGEHKEGKRQSNVIEEEKRTNFVSIGANYLLIHLLGYAVMNAPRIFTSIGTNYNQQTESSVYYGLVVSCIVLAIITPLLPKLLRTEPVTYDEMTLLNVLLLIELATVSVAVGMNNFPLGLCVASLFTPVALVVKVVVRSRSVSIARQIKRIICLILHPLCALTVAMVLYSCHLYPEEGWLKIFTRGRDAAMQAITFSVVDSLIYGNWLYNVAASLLLPIWLLFWQIINISVAKPVNK